MWTIHQETHSECKIRRKAKDRIGHYHDDECAAHTQESREGVEKKINGLSKRYDIHMPSSG